MTATNDGFSIAEVDLELRGPGDFFGTRQSGLPEFRVADLLRDGAMLEEARRDAFALVQADPQLLAPEHRALRAALLTRWRGKLDLAGIGWPLPLAPSAPLRTVASPRVRAPPPWPGPPPPAQTALSCAARCSYYQACERHARSRRAGSRSQPQRSGRRQGRARGGVARAAARGAASALEPRHPRPSYDPGRSPLRPGLALDAPPQLASDQRRSAWRRARWRAVLASARLRPGGHSMSSHSSARGPCDTSSRWAGDAHAAKRDRSCRRALAPRHATVSAQLSAIASAFAETGWVLGTRRTNFGGRPVPPPASVAAARAPGGQTRDQLTPTT